MDIILKALEDKRAAEGLNMSKFADRLQISDTMLILMKQGKRKPGRKFLQAVLRAYPDLSGVVSAYMFGAGEQ